VRVPAAVVSIPLLIGAAAGVFLWDGLPAGFARAGAAAAVFALLSSVGFLALGGTEESLVAVAAGALVAGASLGASAAASTLQPPLLTWFDSRPPARASSPAVLEGTLREDASQSSGVASVTIDAAAVREVEGHGPGGEDRPLRVAGGVRLSVGGALAASRVSEWRGGRRVRVTALLRLPAVYLDPGVRDDRLALARRGIVLAGTIKSAALVEVTGRGTRTQEAAAAARAWIRVQLRRAIGRWSERSAAVATAVLIGDRTGLPDADIRRLQDAGTYHVIAISGGNIAILTGILLAFLARIGFRSRAGMLITLAALCAYGQIVVSSPSVQRAIVVAVIYLGARAFDHRGPPLNLLAVAGALGIAAAPMVLFDPGFLLSFGATLGILAAAAHLPPSGGRNRSRRAAIRDAAGALLWTTVAAEAALLPIAAVLFGRITFAGLILNFAAIPLMSVLQTATLVALALAPAGAAPTAAAGYVAHVAANGIIESARVTELMPWVVRDVVSPSWWVVGAYYVAACAVVVSARPNVVRRASVALACFAGLLVTSPSWATEGMAPPRNGLRIAFLDVGQGDATAVLLPRGRAILVDAGGLATAAGPDAADDAAGGGFDVGARIVAPALRALGVTQLDALAITHGDPDHIGGARAVLRQFRPPVVWEGVPVPPHPGLAALAAAADDLGIRWRTVQAGDVERIGDVHLHVLHPPLPDWERQRVRNEDSIVIDVRMGDVSVLLPGDVGKEGEAAMLPHLSSARIVIVKAPHHGSATSSTPALIERLRPAAVVFSAGRNNRFGHPAPAVMSRYRSAGAVTFSTADDGAVILDTDGKGVSMTTWTGRTVRLPPAAR
jgi:competence protein ComEC